MTTSPSFFSLEEGPPSGTLDGSFPCSSQSWAAPRRFDDDGSHFGFVFEGPTRVTCDAGGFDLATGMYFCIPGAFSVEGGCGLVATRLKESGLFALGGPIEEHGRLSYMDGCSDTLLLSPPVLGDACLNLLVMPPRTRQRMHDHPSARIGVVASGRGRCLSETGLSMRTETPLRAGTAFVIAPHVRHCFHTDDDTMRVIAFHPDTDFGPHDADHPMRNRTVNVARGDGTVDARLSTSNSESTSNGESTSNREVMK